MSKHDVILMAISGVVGYCLCFVVEIWKCTRFQEPPEPRTRKDPADWWKDC